MIETLAIAGTVWQRLMRMKVLYFLVGCAILEIGITKLYHVLMLKHDRMLMVDLSLLLTAIGGLLVVLALAFDIPRELRDGSAAVLLSKPVGRHHYLIGKFIGIALVAMAVMAMIAIGFCAEHRYIHGELPASAVAGHLLTVLMGIPMAAISLFFAAMFSEAPAAILTAVTIWLGHSTSRLADRRILYGGILPDLNLFNLRAEATHGVGIGPDYLALTALWAVLYSAGLIALTCLIFNQRDLK